MNLLFILAILLSIASITNQSASNPHVLWNTFTCTVNTDIVEYYNCSIIGPKNALLTTEVKINRDFEQCEANFALYITRPPSTNYHKTIERKINICQFEKSSLENKFLNIAYKSITSNSNFPRRCPWEKGFYYFRNMNIGENLPAFLPTNNFKVHLNFGAPNLTVFNVTLTGSVIAPGRHSGK